MKKLDSRGFIMAETLVVALFLMSIFTMIYVNFYPMIGEYEKRENYDDVDGKYVAYWIKKLIESDSYVLDSNDYYNMTHYGFIRFECSDINDVDQQKTCISLVNSLEISNCDYEGNGCDAFVTRYQIGKTDDGNASTVDMPDLKAILRVGGPTRWQTATQSSPSNKKGGALFSGCCKSRGLDSCIGTRDTDNDTSTYSLISSNRVSDLYTGDHNSAKNDIVKYCINYVKGKTFSSAIQDYVLSLPNYTNRHKDTNANYRVIVSVHHTRDYNNYYSFSTMEVLK